jgi:hypothetical protein
MGKHFLLEKHLRFQKVKKEKNKGSRAMSSDK